MKKQRGYVLGKNHIFINFLKIFGRILDQQFDPRFDFLFLLPLVMIFNRKGPQIAIKAVARKLAAQYWRLMVRGNEFVEKGVADYEQILRIQKEKYLKKLAFELNVVIEI